MELSRIATDDLLWVRILPRVPIKRRNYVRIIFRENSIPIVTLNTIGGKMSRTYRRKNDKYLIKENRILLDSYWDRKDWTYYYERIDPKSKKGKKKLAKFHSDSPQCIVNWAGPSWFHNLYTQRPYRRDCKRQIQKYLKYDCDISILRKPRSEYFY